MKRVFVVLVIIIFVFTGHSASSIKAQNRDDCSEEDRKLLEHELRSFYLIKGAQPSLENIAILQASRRKIATITSCDPLLLNTFTDMLNLSADGFVASLLEDQELADTLLRTASAMYETVIQLLGSDATATATITFPNDSGTVAFETMVEGTYNSQELDNDDLWLFVAAPNGRIYPQAANACSEDRMPLSLNRFNNTWSANVFFGSESDAGGTFEIILAKLDPEAIDELNALFNSWCATSDFTGISSEELFERLAAEPLDSVVVNRS